MANTASYNKLFACVDFTIFDKQDVCIYIEGGSVQPHGMFQQATRTRNIDTLYYYGEV